MTKRTPTEIVARALHELACLRTDDRTPYEGLADLRSEMLTRRAALIVSRLEDAYDLVPHPGGTDE